MPFMELGNSWGGETILRVWGLNSLRKGLEWSERDLGGYLYIREATTKWRGTKVG